MDFERLISTEKSTIAVKTIRKKCSVITFIFTFVVLVVLIIMFATTSHRLDSIESTLTRVDRTEQADAETLSHKLQKVEEEEVELLGGRNSFLLFTVDYFCKRKHQEYCLPDTRAIERSQICPVQCLRL